MIPRRNPFLPCIALWILTFLWTSTLCWGQLNPFALPQAKLTAAISSSDTILNVDSTSRFPGAGQVAIGTEVLTYTSLTSTTISVSARAQSSTTAAAHDKGSVVTFFPAHAALLTAAIDDKATSMTVNATTSFPPGSGNIILIDQEMLAYTSITTTSFTGLTRAQQGTTAAAHSAGAVIVGRAVLSPTRTYVLPRLISTADGFSGVGLVNLSDGPANLVMNAVNSAGTALTVADANNAQVPVTKSITVGARQQFVGGMGELVGNFGDAKDFYVRMSTGNPLSLGVSPVGNVDPDVGLTRLELIPVVTRFDTHFVLPIALQGSNQFGAAVSLEIGVVGDLFPGQIDASFVNASGNVVQTSSLTPTSNQRLIKNLTDLFSNLKDQTIESGYIRLTSPFAFEAYENLMVGKENGFLNGIQSKDAATSINIPLAISVGPYKIRLILTDSTPAVSGQPPVGVVNALISAYNPDGTLFSGFGITNPKLVTFPVSGQYSQFLSDIFGLSSSQAFMGYLKIDVAAGSSTSGIFASALLLHTGRNQLTAVPGQINPNPTVTLTPALIDPVIMTAFSLVNPNSGTASAEVSLVRADGTVQGTQNLSIAGFGQALPVLSDLFPTAGFTFDSYVVIRSSLPIFGMLVYDSGTFLASGYPLGLPSTFLVSPNPLTVATPVSSSVPASASTHPLTVQIPTPAPMGGLKLNVTIQNSVIATLSANSILIPEGQTTGSVNVGGQISGATVVNVSAPGFDAAAVPVNVQNTTDFTVSRNVTLAPQNPILRSGGSQQFTLTYDTTNHPAVVWLVGGVQGGNNNVGTITQDGFYVAPLLLPSDQPLQLFISATSATTVFFGASTVITVLPPPAS